MPIRTEWYNAEKTILLEAFEGEWTVEDYRHLIDEAHQRLSTVQHTVHIIVDGTRNCARLPSNMLRSGLSYAVHNLPANQGITVFVSIDTITEMLIGIARNINPRLHRTLFSTDSLAKALALVAEQTSPTG